MAAAMAADRIAHEQVVERIRRSHKLALVVAERVARRRAVYTGLSRGAVRRALEALQDAGIIESRGRAEWRITSPLLRRYLETM
jgi:DNA-binding transcriptional ArsR family regulator